MKGVTMMQLDSRKRFIKMQDGSTNGRSDYGLSLGLV